MKQRRRITMRFGKRDKRRNARRVAWTLKVVAILCGILALTAFGAGSYTAYRAFERLNKTEQPAIAP